MFRLGFEIPNWNLKLEVTNCDLKLAAFIGKTKLEVTICDLKDAAFIGKTKFEITICDLKLEVPNWHLKTGKPKYKTLR